VATYREETTESQSIPTISSSDGWNSVGFRFRKNLQAGDRRIILAELIIDGSFWDREKALASALEANLESDYQVVLPQVLLSEDRVRKLISHLGVWSERHNEFKIRISETNDQKVSIFIGSRRDFICQPDHPVFSLKYTTSRMKAEWSFVTDQSCISIFLQSLKDAVVGSSLS